MGNEQAGGCATGQDRRTAAHHQARGAAPNALRSRAATQAPTIAPTAPAFAPNAPATTAFATSAALDATLAATTKDDP